MDIRMPGMDGIEATQMITAGGSGFSGAGPTRVVVLTTFDDDDYVYAGRLVISTATAKAHVARLLAKLGARDRVQLVIVAYQAGLVSPSAGPHPPQQK